MTDGIKEVASLAGAVFGSGALFKFWTLAKKNGVLENDICTLKNDVKKLKETGVTKLELAGFKKDISDLTAKVNDFPTDETLKLTIKTAVMEASGELYEKLEQHYVRKEVCEQKCK